MIVKHLIAGALVTLMGSSVTAADLESNGFKSGPFLAPVREYILSFHEIQAICGENSIADANSVAGAAIAGCALFGKGSELGWHLRFEADSCNVFILEGTPQEEADTREHELRHCRGWNPDHNN